MGKRNIVIGEFSPCFLNGGYLYHNGGNMFYSDVVDMNEKLIELF